MCARGWQLNALVFHAKAGRNREVFTNGGRADVDESICTARSSLACGLPSLTARDTKGVLRLPTGTTHHDEYHPGATLKDHGSFSRPASLSHHSDENPYALLLPERCDESPNVCLSGWSGICHELSLSIMRLPDLVLLSSGPTQRRGCW